MYNRKLSSGLTNKVYDCPSCTAPSDNIVFLNPNDSYYDVKCCICGTEYKLILKYLCHDINPIVKKFILQNRLNIKELSLKYEIPSVDVMAFLEKPTFYNLNMYKVASEVLGVDLKEITSYTLVDKETYENERNKIKNVC